PNVVQERVLKVMSLLIHAFRCTLIILSLNLFINTKGISQDKIKWGKIPKEQLSMDSYPEDPDAKAVILVKNGEIDFVLSPEFGIKMKKHIRIKILDEEAFDLGNVNLDYYHRGKFQDISNIKAQSISPTGDISKLSKKEVFETKGDDDWTKIKFAIPNIQKGSVIEYSYEFEQKSVASLPVWYFQSTYPTLYSNVKIDVPEILHFKDIKMNITNIEQEESESVATVMLGDDRGGPSTKATVKTNNKSYTMRNISALDVDDFVYNPSDFYAKILFQLYATEFRKGDIREFNDTWKTYALNKIENPNFGKEYLNPKKSENLRTAFKATLTGKETEKENILKVQNFLSKNMSWDEEMRIFSDKNLDDAWKNKKANSAELNLMAIALLREQGVNINPVLVSTRRNGKVITIYPVLNQFNHVITQIITSEGEKLFLDVSPYALGTGWVRASLLNNEGLVINDSGRARWVKIDAPLSRYNGVSIMELDEEGNISGILKSSSNGYYASTARRRFIKEEDEKNLAKEYFQEDYQGVEILEVEKKNLKELNKRFATTIKYELEEALDVTEDVIYIPTILDKGWGWHENPLTADSRSFNLDIHFPFKDKYAMNYKLPEGYIVDDISEPIIVSTPSGSATFKYNSSISPNGKSLQVIMELQFSKIEFSPNEYPEVKNLLQIVSDKANEMIVLKKQ
ncbi:MAG: DUF3857 domain-containing protein, partial [Saprospiraceae bacterium]